MRRYEALYIVDAELTEEQLAPIMEKYKKVVTDMGGEVSDASPWEQGRRRLAYQIDKRREGLYVLMRFESDGNAPKELDRVFRISDDVFRHLIVKEEIPPVAVAEAESSEPADAEAVETVPAEEPAGTESVEEQVPEVTEAAEPEGDIEPGGEAEAAAA